MGLAMGRSGGAFHAYARAPADCGETGLPEWPRQQKGPQRAQEGVEGPFYPQRLHPGWLPSPQGVFLFNKPPSEVFGKSRLAVTIL